MIPVQKPEVLLAQANTKFDETGNLVDKVAGELIAKKLLLLKEAVLQKRNHELP
jgi:hypothetical protein